jgi:hypothetical protein
VEACYSGPAGTEDVLPCHPGSRQCLADGSDWGRCEGEITPTAEICANGADEDCDGWDLAATGCLSDEGLIVRYFVDEAQAGQGPTQLEDAAPGPLPLALTWADGFSFCERFQGRALCWDAAADAATARVAVAGTKVADALDGAVAVTIEIVVVVDPSMEWTRLLSIGSASYTYDLSLVGSNGSARLQWHGGTDIGQWWIDLNSGARRVLHAVLDTTQELAADRVVLYVDGTRAANAGTWEASQNETITLGDNSAFILGNSYPSNDPLEGSIGYAALYSVPFDAAMAAAHAAALAQYDDSP